MSDPIQGFDVSVSVLGPNGPELVGEYKEIEIRVKHNVEKYEETGERIARLLDGDIEISGKLKRGWMHVDVLRRVLGYSALRRGQKIGAQPRFTISASVDSTDKGLSGRIRVENAVIGELGIIAKGGKAVVEKDLSYQAEGIAEA